MLKFVYGTYIHDTIVGLVIEENPVKILNLTEASKHLGHLFPSTLLEGIQHGEHFVTKVENIVEELQSQGEWETFMIEEQNLDILAPIPRPRKNIFCIGKNYREHALELGSEADIPEVPMVFSKAPTAVIGPNRTVSIPESVTNELDYEGELAVVIGKAGKGISREEAYDHVFGYTIINDITARDLQFKHKQFLIGKSMDTSCPMGPFLVHKSAIPDPHDLHITTEVNDETRQQSSTSQMIFSIPDLIAEISKGMTLEAGDIIATGTPAGVGKGFNPPKYLKDEDVVSIRIEHVGVLTNQVRIHV